MGDADEKLKNLFGEALKESRRKAGISQQELAFDCGLDRTYISLLERGLRQPTIRTVFVLSEALQIRPSQFIQKIEQSL
jgi:transcriptional regulator with XRE-family HTH domain